VLQEKTELNERNKILEEERRWLESEKMKLSEKWIKLSSRSRVDTKARDKAWELEIQLENSWKEIGNINETFQKLQRENNLLWAANESLEK